MKKLLNDGFIDLVSIMGDDDSIVQAARTSTGNGTTTPERDRELIRYLLRHKHTSPFEMIETKWHIRVPIFIARQWLRHRTANVNEISGRYSVMESKFYIPKVFKTQSKINHQGSDNPIEYELNLEIQKEIEKHFENTYKLYEDLLKNGVSKEQARIVLPLSLYTEFYWKIDLHNLFNFLKLRMDSHAQEEIQLYATEMFNILKQHLPVSCEAFEEYILEAKTFSKTELDLIKTNIDKNINLDKLSKLEKIEFTEKIANK